MLSYTHRVLLVAVVGLLASWGRCAEPPTAKQIAQWIEQLGDNSFAVRENASKKLWQAGAAAESAVAKAVKSDDPEVSRRARDLHDKFRWGIYPDTPADIVALIRAYPSSDSNTRKEILQKLLEDGDVGLRSVFKIAAAEKDVDQLKLLGNLIAYKLPAAFQSAVVERKYEHFETLLEMGHKNKFIANRQYIAYWLLRGKVTERIAHFQAQLNAHPDDKRTAETLAYLHRANDDLASARKAAEKAGRDDLLEGILQEMGDWQALVALTTVEQSKPKPHTNVYGIEAPPNRAERWAFHAAYARLAGNPKEFENAVRELQKFVPKEKEDELPFFVAAKGLLLNDRVSEGVTLLRNSPERQELVFDILCARLDYKAALNLKIPNDREVPPLDFARARILCLLGDKEGKTRFQRFGESIKDEVDSKWVEDLLREEMRAGLNDLAFAHAAKALGVTPRKTEKGNNEKSPTVLYLTQLFPQQGKAADVWWTILRQQFRAESSAAVLKRVRDVLEGKAMAKEVKAWIEKAELRLSESKQSLPHAAERLALAEGAIEAGLDDLAESLLEKADTRAALLRLGDLLAAKKQWDKAAERYQQAWNISLQLLKRQRLSAEEAVEAHDPLPLFLAGDALVRAGREAEGKRLIDRAHWLPLADELVRHRFLRELSERRHTEAAQRETELLRRTSEPNTLYSGAAIRRDAIAALQRKDYLQAAQGLDQSMLRCLHAYASFVLPAAYVTVPAQIHQIRAQGLLAAGKVEEALKQADLALDIAPGDVDIPMALLPTLERLGRKKEADALFERCNKLYESVCRDYPRCAWAHNSTAWMSACCRRQLDRALTHAEKAVELAPTNAGYLDTLAEVHFQRGDKEKAIAVQKRAIKLDPKRAYYRKQLKRLEAGDPKAERPSESEDE